MTECNNFLKKVLKKSIFSQNGSKKNEIYAFVHVKVRN